MIALYLLRNTYFIESTKGSKVGLDFYIKTLIKFFFKFTLVTINNIKKRCIKNLNSI